MLLAREPKVELITTAVCCFGYSIRETATNKPFLGANMKVVYQGLELTSREHPSGSARQGSALALYAGLDLLADHYAVVDLQDRGRTRIQEDVYI